MTSLQKERPLIFRTFIENISHKRTRVLSMNTLLSFYCGQETIQEKSNLELGPNRSEIKRKRSFKSSENPANEKSILTGISTIIVFQSFK